MKLKQEEIELNWWQRIVNRIITSPIVFKIWQMLPSRCQHPDCDNEYMRYFEHEMWAGPVNKPEEAEHYWICEGCVHKLRQAAFQNGFVREEVAEGVTKYVPPAVSESERSE